MRAEHRAAPQTDRHTGAEPVLLGTAGELTVVDLVAAQRRLPVPQGLLRREDDVGVQQAQTLDAARVGLHPVVDGAAQHLEAAAHAEHRPARRGVRDDAVGQSAFAQPAEVGHRRLAAGQHHDVGVGEVGGVG